MSSSNSAMADEGSFSPIKISPKAKPSQDQQNRKSSRDGKNKSPRVRKRKRRFEPTEKLPTPPPDPYDVEKICSGESSAKRKSLSENKENDFPSSPRGSLDLSTNIEFNGNGDAFDHLNKLHSLVEQILELRAKNARLFRRVRDLERVRAVKKLETSTRRTFLRGEFEPRAPDEDVGFAESLLSAMIESSTSTSSGNQSTGVSGVQEVARVRSFRSPMTRQRSRSIGNDAIRPAVVSKRSSCYLQYGGGKRNSLAGSLCFAQPKVSKWTKVKAAFKWEKAGTGTSVLSNVVAEALEHDSARFLKLPVDPSDATTPSGSSARTAEHSGPPSPGTISSSSSTDDVYCGIQKRTHTARTTTREIDEDPTRRSRSLDGEFVIPHNIIYAAQHSRDGSSRRLEKGYKTPWGMVKEIIQSRRESIRRPLPRGSIRSEDGYSLSSLESSDMLNEVLNSDHATKARVQVTTSDSSLAVPCSKLSSSTAITSGEIVDLATRRLTPTLTITVPSSEELRSVSTPESVSPPTSHHQTLDSISTDAERSPSEDPDSASSPKCTRSVSAVATSSTLSLRERRRSSANVSSINTGTSPGEKPRLHRQDSKWNKVKRAFLTSASSVPPSPSRTSSFFYETDGGGSYSASAEDLENNGGVSPSTQADIQRNYQILHDKLSTEFYRKLTEWEKLKNGQSSVDSSRSTGPLRSSTTPSVSTASPKEKDSANALLMGEEQLTPEFKKKLQEWKRMKKPGGGGNNVSGTTSPENQIFRRRLTDWQIWRTPTKSEGKSAAADVADNSGRVHLSEDFLKKMEEWKKIKSGRSDEEQSASGRRDSGELVQQIRNSDKRWKTIDDKEFQPLDRVIAMIEREQQMIEKQKEKLINKKSRLDELSRIIDSTNEKRDVLVHTSTGFYKFEGISQEFTKKLYEWEKSQGIGPESSTLQLLNPAYRINTVDNNSELTRENYLRAMKRAKSMSSVVESSQRVETPIRQPSSLSLNDVTNLENEAKLRIDSKQTIGEEEMSEDLLEDSEPEAVIVDIEDVIEETASPMARFQPQQTPVYCVTASETTSLAIPLGTVTASHEPSPVILIQPGENYHQLQRYCQISPSSDADFGKDKINLDTGSNNSQMTNSDISGNSTEENRRRIFDSNEIGICETIIEEEVTSSHIGEESNSDADLSSSSVIEDETNANGVEEQKSDERMKPSPSDLEREIEQNNDHLSSGITEAGNISNIESSSESSTFKTSDYTSTTRENSRTSEQIEDELEEEATYDARVPRDRSLAESMRDAEMDDVVITVSSSNMRQKKVLKTRRLTDTQVGYKWRQSSQKIEETSPEPADDLTVSTYSETPSVERIIINESTLNKIVVPTASNEALSNLVSSSDPQTSSSNSNLAEKEEQPYCRRLTNKSESKSVLVKTKRIIFSPFSRRSSKDKTTNTVGSQKDKPETKKVTPEPPVAAIRPSNSSVQVPTPKISNNIQRSKSSSECPVTYEKRPPIPQSPILSRKDYRRSSPKETAPSIRMMIQRYNQKLQEDASSPASSGSGSPIWRSPTSERRVRTQMEKYQEEVRKAIAGTPKKDGSTSENGLEKSASAGIIQPSIMRSPCIRNLRHEILKSTSADFVRNPDSAEKDEDTMGADSEDIGIVVTERRRSSLQNTKAEIFSNIQQCLVQEYKTLPIKNEATEEKVKRNSTTDSGRSFEQKVTVNLANPEQGRRNCGKISPDLIHKLNALSNAATQKLGRYFDERQQSSTTASENSTPLRIRAQRIKKAKDDFFSRGPGCQSHDPSRHRHSQSSSPSIDLSVGGADFVKSASAGMINVERMATSSSSSESTQTTMTVPRCQESKNYPVEVTGTLSKIASKFRRAKLKRGGNKDKENKNMSTVSMLCRQSLLVDIQPGEMSKSCPTSPSSSHRDDDENNLRFKQHRDSN